MKGYSLRICIITVALLFVTANLFAADEIVVMVNDTGPLVNISEAEIREIYLGNIRFVRGVAVMPIHYHEGNVKNAFLASVVKMTSREYRFYWTKKVFQEGISAPASQNSSAPIIVSVKKSAGAIGYMPKSELDDARGIRIIATIKNQ